MHQVLPEVSIGVFPLVQSLTFPEPDHNTHNLTSNLHEVSFRLLHVLNWNRPMLLIKCCCEPFLESYRIDVMHLLRLTRILCRVLLWVLVRISSDWCHAICSDWPESHTKRISAFWFEFYLIDVLHLLRLITRASILVFGQLVSILTFCLAFVQTVENDVSKATVYLDSIFLSYSARIENDQHITSGVTVIMNLIVDFCPAFTETDQNDMWKLLYIWFRFWSSVQHFLKLIGILCVLFAWAARPTLLKTANWWNSIIPTSSGSGAGRTWVLSDPIYCRLSVQNFSLQILNRKFLSQSVSSAVCLWMIWEFSLLFPLKLKSWRLILWFRI